MSQKNNFLCYVLLTFSLSTVKFACSMNPSHGKEPDFTGAQGNTASLKEWLYAELNKQYLDLKRIEDLIDLGAGLELSDKEKDTLLAIVKAKSTEKQSNFIKKCLAGPVINLHSFSGRETRLTEARARIYGSQRTLSTSTTSSSSSSSSSISSSSRKRSATVAALTQPPSTGRLRQAPIIIIDDDEQEIEVTNQALSNGPEQPTRLSIDQLSLSLEPWSPTSFLDLNDS